MTVSGDCAAPSDARVATLLFHGPDDYHGIATSYPTEPIYDTAIPRWADTAGCAGAAIPNAVPVGPDALKQLDGSLIRRNWYFFTIDPDVNLALS
jgi:hypothetical protein